MPVIKWETLGLIVRIAIHKSWPILHLNVQTYFLNGFLLEEIHMEQLVGLVELGVNIKFVFSSGPYIA